MSAKNYKNWLSSGLLEDLREEDAKRLACAMERIANSRIEEHAKGENRRVETLVFPIMRGVFSDINEGRILKHLSASERESLEKTILPQERRWL